MVHIKKIFKKKKKVLTDSAGGIWIMAEIKMVVSK